MENLKTIILAAGAGTRMKSELAKVLHKAAGKTLLEHVLKAAKEADSKEVAVIVGHQADAVSQILPEDVLTFEQTERLGTGHAVLQAKEFYTDPGATILVLNGDAPLITADTIKQIASEHEKHKNAVTVLTAELENPTGYGRIITEEGQIVRIVEERDANDQEKAIKEVNSGIYCFDAKALEEALEEIRNDNEQHEYYLTDAVEIIRKAGLRAGTCKVQDSDDIAAANTNAQLAELEAIFRKRINSKLMDEGVTIIDPAVTYIEADVKVGPDTVIYPGTLIEGKTVIGRECKIGMNSHITDSQIADCVDIESSTIIKSTIGSGSHIGPYAYIRPDSHIGKDVKVGDFVEVKNSVIKDGAKASHLTYIGDSEVGRNVNLGCGTVFVNYDGKDKHRTVVEDNCFIGCNSNLVSPVLIKEGSYIAAGSTITDDVPEQTLAIARARQINKEGYTQNMAFFKKGKE